VGDVVEVTDVLAQGSEGWIGELDPTRDGIP
jgi:hypothetical protein